MTYLFISPSETEVIKVAVTYFHTVFWFYPFLGSIFLYRNTLQGMGYGLIPMIGGIFELVARTAIVTLVAGKTSFAGVCMADPAAWLAALVPLLPYYFYIMRKWKNSDLLNWQNWRNIEIPSSIFVILVAARWMFAYALASNTCSETTNMDDGISMFLTVVSEVKSEIMLKRFGDSPKDSDFMRKYSESITVY